MNKDKLLGKETAKKIEWLNNNREYYIKAIELCKIKNHKTVLDLGCGYGLWSYELLRNNRNVFGIDIDRHSVTYANHLKTKEKGHSNIHFINGSGEILPFKDGVFDSVIAISVLQYVNRDKLFKEVTRILKKNGLFISILNHGFGYYLYRFLQINRSLRHVLNGAFTLSRQIICKNINYSNKSVEELYLTRSEIDDLCKKNNLSHKYLSLDHPFHSSSEKYLLFDFVISFIGRKC